MIIILIMAAIAAQIYLSTNKNKNLGLIFPALSGIGSVLTMLLTFTSTDFSFGDILSYIMAFAFFNIPTLVLLGIYFIAQKGVKLNSEIDRMNILDL